MQEVTEARRKQEVMEQHMNRSVSTVSQSTTRRRSIASAVFHDASNVLQTRHETVAEEDQIDRDETIRKNRMNPVMVPVTSTNMAVSSTRMTSAQNVASSRVSVQRPTSAAGTTNATTKVMTSAGATSQRPRNTSVQSDESSEVSVRRPASAAVPLNAAPATTTNVMTSTRNADQRDRMASTSLQLLSTSKVNQYLSDLNLSPLHDRIEDTPLSSTFRRDVPTTAFSSGAGGLQPPTTQPIMTTTTDAQQNRPLGDAKQLVFGNQFRI